jgi:hypothetical protein
MKHKRPLLSGAYQFFPGASPTMSDEIQSLFLAIPARSWGLKKYSVSILIGQNVLCSTLHNCAHNVITAANSLDSDKEVSGFGIKVLRKAHQ